jgi:hypothetical protein
MTAAAFAEEGDRRTAIEIAAEAYTPTAKTRETCAPIGPLAINPGK